MLAGGDDYVAVGQAADRLGRPGRPRGVDRLAGPGRVRGAGGAGRAASWPRRSSRRRRCWPRCWARTSSPARTGCSAIARRVAKDRVISTVDPEARHGHKTASRGFDGYKGHAAVDPDSEIITATAVTPGNTGDAAAAEDLIADLLDEQPDAAEPAGEQGDSGRAGRAGRAGAADGLRRCRLRHRGVPRPARRGRDRVPVQDPGADRGGRVVQQGPLRHRPRRADRDLPGRGHRPDPGGPQRRRRRHRLLRARPAPAARCVRSAPPPKAGRTISVGPHEQALADARARQTDPAWVADYRATRPKVERKIGHLMRRRHGGRRARVRGTDRVAADFRLLAAAVNLARLAVLGLRGTADGWAVTTCLTSTNNATRPLPPARSRIPAQRASGPERSQQPVPIRPPRSRKDRTPTRGNPEPTVRHQPPSDP